MKATLMYGAGDVRIGDVPDPAIHAPTDAIVRVVRGVPDGYRAMADRQSLKVLIAP